MSVVSTFNIQGSITSVKGGKERKGRVSYIKVPVSYKVHMDVGQICSCNAVLGPRFLGVVPLKCYAMLVVYKIDVVY